ncbi:N-acetylglucosamine-6-phosphate deacetylase isoform X2 [Hyalella azteca]|uniref:N-acetylglucosamine-6-phosphate deacetylase n=1 Tax=Hyalella azteca TaxID=294128 RepID=A0A8B7NME8_HYAAZ|nr:N-acetylglucosamine-6-phosphate deacetylase isoform X2 [Hyalella azteca]
MVGGYGFDFSSDPTKVAEAVSVVSKGLLSTGVTSFCPTLVTSPPELYKKVLPQLSRRPGSRAGAAVLGAHVEGPFINPEKKGAHPPEHMLTFAKGPGVLEEVYGSLEHVAMITLAPELPGAEQAVEFLAQRRVVVSVGHSSGSLEQGEAAVVAGASFITHLFNAMLPFHHRDPGLVGLLTSKVVPRPVYYGIISDGVHTHPAALRIAHRTHPGGLVLITDAMAALGLGEGEHNIGQLAVEVRGRRAFLPGTDTLAGSIATMDECIRRFIKAAGVSLEEGVRAATEHPARLLGLATTKGSLVAGADADFVMLGDDGDTLGNVDVMRTFIAGQCVYERPGLPALQTWTC